MIWNRPICLYASFLDIDPKRLEPQDSQLVEILSSFPPPTCVDCTGKNCPIKKHHPCWSPVTIRSGGSRCNEDVETVNYAVFDLDHLANIAPVLEAIDGYAAVIHSTHSHGSDDGSYRLVMPLSRPCTLSEWPGVRAGIVRALALPADPQTKDSSRLYALPDTRIGVSPYCHVQEGDALDVDLLVRPQEEVIRPTKEVTSIDLGALREILEAVRDRKKNGTDHARGQAKILNIILEGKSLGDIGGRHSPRVRATALLSTWLPANTPWDVAYEIMRPCLQATPLAGGESFQGAVEKTKRLYIEAMENRIKRDEERKAEELRLRQIFRDLTDRFERRQ